MYYTLQIRLKLSKQQRKELTKFETIYNEDLNRIVTQMDTTTRCYPYSYYHYAEEIHDKSCWSLYQMAVRMSKAHVEKRKASYNRSGTWATASYEITNDLLVLKFGKSFVIEKGCYILAMDKNQQRRLLEGKQRRLDLVHDEAYWYCNILMQIDEKVVEKKNKT